MFTLKMKNEEHDREELFTEMLPVIVTLLGLLAVLILYFLYD